MVLRKELGDGETAAIALAVREKADWILLDDLAARLVAEELGLQVIGTLGILITAYEKGDLIEMLDVPTRTLARAMKDLQERGLIEHRGSKKTEGYFVLGEEAV